MSPERIKAMATAFALFVGVELVSTPAEAQLSYRLAPVGGRSQLLGGTGLAFGRDAAASFLNPATAVLVDDQRLSFSANFYKLTYTNASNWYAPGAIDRGKFGNVDVRSASLTDLDFDTLPSSLCFYFTSAKFHFYAPAAADEGTKDAHIGLCFATVDSGEFNFGAEDFSEVRASGSVTRQVQTLSQKFTRFAAGPTYAVRLNNALSVGASVHASATSFKSLLASSATTYGSPSSPISSSFYGASKGVSFQVDATLGATLRFGHQTLGVSVRTPSLHVFGNGGVNRDTTYQGAGSETLQLAANGSFTAQSPMRIGIGTGVEGAWGQFEINAFYFHQLGNSYTASFEGQQTTTSGSGVADTPVKLDLHQRSNGVVNLAAGAEMFVSENISFLTGISTDVSAAPGGTLQGTLFNYFGVGQNKIAGTIGVGTHGANGELMIGTELSYGWGERLAVNSYQLPPVIGTADFNTYQMMLIIAGSTSLRALKKVVEDVKKVVNEPTSQKSVMTPTVQEPASNPTPQKAIDMPTDTAKPEPKKPEPQKPEPKKPEPKPEPKKP